jgi:hypothetical protein
MSEKTIYKETTPHGYGTPHKFPSETADIVDSLRDLSVQLYPTGRAWYKPENGNFQRFHDAINISLVRLIDEGKLLLDQTFPDNENFSKDDASLWEYRLGLITNNNLDLELRKAGIKRKLGHPNNVKSRQHKSFIEHQLQLSGFNVWVHENTIPYRTPNEILLISSNDVQHEESTQHGLGLAHGGDSFSLIANSIEEIEDYSIGGAENLWATFFIGGENLGDSANVPSLRLREFKELVIKLKPANLVAITFINYV